jgi:hypothetical protein
MTPLNKPLVWLRGEVKTPPFSPDARLEAGVTPQATAARRDAFVAALETDAKHQPALS